MAISFKQAIYLWLALVCSSVYLDIQHKNKHIAETHHLQSNVAKKQVFPFSIQTIPSNTDIRIMNIKPRYQPGMNLSEGNYDVEISAQGHITKRLWIKHKAANIRLVRLEKVKHESAL